MEGRIPKVLASGLFALFFAAIIAALTVFGVISMTLGHVFMILAGVVGTILLRHEILPNLPGSRKLLAYVLLWGTLAICDYVIVRHKDAENSASLPVQPIATPQPSNESTEPHLWAELAVDSSRKLNTAMRVIIDNNGPVKVKKHQDFFGF